MRQEGWLQWMPLGERMHGKRWWQQRRRREQLRQRRKNDTKADGDWLTAVERRHRRPTDRGRGRRKRTKSRIWRDRTRTVALVGGPMRLHAGHCMSASLHKVLTRTN